MTLLSGYFIINMLINSFDPIIGRAESISFRLFFTKVKARIKYRNKYGNNHLKPNQSRFPRSYPGFSLPSYGFQYPVNGESEIGRKLE